MDYEKIEGLVVQAKLGHEKAKEELVAEFTPLILNISKKSFIDSYEFSDISNECYKTLFKCVKLYNTDKHRFVAYATNAIKNTINNLIRISKRRSPAEGSEAYILYKLEENLYSDEIDMDLILNNEFYKSKLDVAMKKLNNNDRELIDFIYFKNNTFKSYSKIKGIPYSTVIMRKNIILNELKEMLGLHNGNNLLN